MTALEAPPVEQANPLAASSPATKPPGLTERLAVATRGGRSARSRYGDSSSSWRWCSSRPR